MKNDTSELLTYTTVRIVCDDKSIGTGFVIELCKKGNECKPVIVTNRHVINGFKKYQYEMCIADQDGQPIDTEVVCFEGEVTEWILHPNPEIDLACLPIAPLIRESNKRGLKPYYRSFDTTLIPTIEQMNELSVIEDIFVIGYPTGLEDTVNHKPLIRKGITSTHPKNDYMGKPHFVIDCSIFPGSSGSPVVIYNRGGYPIPEGIQFGERLILLGIICQTFLHDLITISVDTTSKQMDKIPNDLGLVIKSSQILEFEKLLGE
ncbi:serine protease [Candidatus Methanarcanum hacksteinii]|uniref:serine protease n=1 Tax=Candidatus Methanarcanum hacksteinii TaxID=2911857 RepID=UPI0037DC361D